VQSYLLFIRGVFLFIPEAFLFVKVDFHFVSFLLAFVSQMNDMASFFRNTNNKERETYVIACFVKMN
jgi:hypothetical protein